MKDEELKWKLLKKESIEKNEWIDIQRCEYQFPNGTTFGPYYNFKKKSYTIIVAQDTEGNFLCVKQYRHGIDKITTEFPAGAIEKEEYKKDTDKEVVALECAQRELQEETGYASNDWTHLITIPSSPTDADNEAYCFFAKGCEKVSQLHLDATEVLEPEKYSAQEIEDLIDQDAFQQPLHLMCWLLVKQYIGK